MKNVMLGVVAFCFLLAGCVTPEDLAKQDPNQSFDTSANIEMVRDCIIAEHGTEFDVHPFGRGWQVIGGGVEVTNFTVNLSPIPLGTHVEVRLGKTLAHHDYYLDVEPCLEKLPRITG